MSTATRPTLAFFGATGGCAGGTLALSLNAGYECTALARSSTKLATYLAKTHSVPEATISSNLTIIEGDIDNIPAIKQTLTTKTSTLPSLIISGLGGTPAMQASLVTPIIVTDPNLCERGAHNIINALTELQAANPALRTSTGEQKPSIATLSTTGISTRARDVPFAMVALYHWILKIPHIDKRKMEDAYIAATTPSGPARSVTIVRPTLLTDGAAKGAQAVKVGWERPEGEEKPAWKGEMGPGPQMGYTISRADVAGWIFENIVQGGGVWEDRAVSLAY